MKTINRITLSTSPLSQPARKPRETVNLTRRHRYLYRGSRRYHIGKERDLETGLYYYGARYLDSKTGRWLSGDPAVGDYVPSAPVDDEARKRNGNLPGQGGVFNYVNLHVYHYAGNNPVKLVDPNGRTGSFPDGSPEQDAQWEKAMADREPAERLTYADIDLPENGPCNMRALIGVAEASTGKNLSKNKLNNLITTLTTGTSPLVDKNDKYDVKSDTGVVEAALDEILGVGASDKLTVVITRPEDKKNYPAAKANAMYSLLAVGRRDNSNTPGHWQVGDSNGNFLWDPLSGKDNGNRNIFEAKTRYISITPR